MNAVAALWSDVISDALGYAALLAADLLPVVGLIAGVALLALVIGLVISRATGGG